MKFQRNFNLLQDGSTGSIVFMIVSTLTITERGA